MLRVHPRLPDVSGVVPFRENTHVFRRGVRGEAAGRINEAQTVHPGLMCP
jgi:hypothetical protein